MVNNKWNFNFKKNMKIKLIVLTVLSLFVFNIIKAQNGVGNFRVGSFNDGSAWSDVFNKKLKESDKYTLPDMKGSPYEYKDFTFGKLFYKNNLEGEFPLRYDIYADEIQIMNGEETGALLKTKDIHVNINGLNYFLLGYVLDEVFREGYFIEKLKGKNASLLIKKRKFYMEGQPAQNSFIRAVAPKFTDNETYFGWFEGVNQPVYIPKQKRKFIALFPENRKIEIQKYLKENKLNLSKIEDLEKFFEFYNQQ